MSGEQEGAEEGEAEYQSLRDWTKATFESGVKVLRTPGQKHVPRWLPRLWDWQSRRGEWTGLAGSCLGPAEVDGG